MNNNVAMISGALLLFACTILTMAPSTAHAGNVVCVVCKNPDLTYRCKVMRDDGTIASKGFEVYCMKEIARKGHHQSCSVKRQADGVCDGFQKTLVYNGAPPASPLNNNLGQEPGYAPGQQILPPTENIAKREKGEPRTLIEFTDQTVKNTKKGLKNTGVAIGGAAKKTSDTVVGAVKKTGSSIGGVAKKTGDTVVGAVKKTGSTIGGAAKKTGQAIGGAAKKTGQVIGGAAKKTGNAVGSAAKSTYNCVTSLFTDCF